MTEELLPELVEKNAIERISGNTAAIVAEYI